MGTGEIVVHGDVADGFGPVRDEFARNFRERGDLGAGCTAYTDGLVVVDLWAGVADKRTGRPYAHDSATVIFSCTKGIMAACAYRLVQEGRLDLDAPVARYWPEFASAGKERITVREVMAHRAGLAYLDIDLTREEVLAWAPVIRALEAQPPHHQPADGHAYHALTVGWLVGELMRRVSGMSPGAYLRREFGDPLRLDTWVGIPDDQRGKVAWMEPPLPDDESEMAREFARTATSRAVQRSLNLGPGFGIPLEDGIVSLNASDIQAAEIPGAGGISSAASLARLYAACLTGVDGGAPMLTGASIQDAVRVISAGPQLTGQPDDGPRWGTGFQLASPPSAPMLGPSSFGHTGAGGQLAFADVEHRASFAYVTNQMGGYGDVRARSLTSALRRALDA